MDNTLKYNKPWILQRADPYVYKHTDGAYYFTASVPEYDRIVLRKSDTLAGLETADETEIWHKHESGPQSIHIWAPELHYLYALRSALMLVPDFSLSCCLKSCKRI